MPICPGCERLVPYNRLDVHERYCRGIWGEPSPATVAIEKLDRRLQRLEADLERRLANVERARRSSKERTSLE